MHIAIKFYNFSFVSLHFLNLEPILEGRGAEKEYTKYY